MTIHTDYCLKVRDALAGKMDMSCNCAGKTLRAIAEENVVAIRGSDDVPAFDLCVDAEMRRLRSQN